jgi:hypothetical protein
VSGFSVVLCGSELQAVNSAAAATAIQRLAFIVVFPSCVEPLAYPI